MRMGHAAGGLLGVLSAATAIAQEGEPTIEVTVEGEASPANGLAATVETSPGADVVDGLTDLPGVWAVRRGSAGAEPVIRGQGFERVATQLGPLPLYGACPGRMDPPAGYLRPTLVGGLEVVKGLPSVTLGPAGTAGRIHADPDGGDRPDGVEGRVEAGIDASRSGGYGRGVVAAGGGSLDGRLAAEMQSYGDYRSGDGRLVPSGQSEFGGAVAVGAVPGSGHRSWHTVGYQRDEHVDYPSLPMDLESTDAWLYDGGYRTTIEDPVLRGSEVRFAMSRFDHVMNNERKPNRGILEAEARTQVRGVGSSAQLGWQVGPVTFDTGAQLSLVRRDGTRERYLPGSGMRFEDRLWPDARQGAVGVFTEAHWAHRDRLRLRIGGRIDHVTSSVGGGAEPSLGGRTIRAQYVAFNGASADRLAEDEVVGGGNVLTEWRLGARATTYMGVGTSARAAGLTERFLAFAPAPGGFQVGNPALRPERKVEWEWGTVLERSWLALATNVYAHRYTDYIEQTVVLRDDLNGDGAADLLRGFRNVDARLIGGEVSVTPRLVQRVTLPTTFAVVHGQDTTHDEPLAEIPPWELRTGLRIAQGGRSPWWALVGVRGVGRQDRIDPDFGEDATDGFTTVHVRAAVYWRRMVRFEAGIENLFDLTYNEHLTREAVLSVGDLEAGDEVPAPGRFVHLAVRIDF